MKTEQEPKDLSIEELFKITEVLQQTTERRMKLDIFFKYRDRPTTKTASQNKLRRIGESYKQRKKQQQQEENTNDYLRNQRNTKESKLY